MRGGTQSFVSQMTKMVGTEPLESSHGDQSLLPTYMVNAVQKKIIIIGDMRGEGGREGRIEMFFGMHDFKQE